MMKLSAREKREMLQEAKSAKRRYAFSVAGKITDRKMSFEEYLNWLQQVVSAFPGYDKSLSEKQKFMIYKNAKI